MPLNGISQNFQQAGKQSSPGPALGGAELIQNCYFLSSDIIRSLKKWLKLKCGCNVIPTGTEQKSISNLALLVSSLPSGCKETIKLERSARLSERRGGIVWREKK